MCRMKLVINGTLPGLNEYIAAERTNRYKGAALKRQSEQIVTLAIKKHLRGVKFTNQVTMFYTFYERNRKRDKDNVRSFAHKVIQDALVRAGVLKNDGWAQIADSPGERFAVDAKNPRIEVQIYEHSV